MRKFDTKVQYLKYKVLREVAREAWADSYMKNAIDIPKIIVPGKTSTMRCCVYKERAILAERVKIAMGAGNNSSNVIQVIDIACDECPAAGYACPAGHTSRRRKSPVHWASSCRPAGTSDCPWTASHRRSWRASPRISPRSRRSIPGCRKTAARLPP